MNWFSILKPSHRYRRPHNGYETQPNVLYLDHDCMKPPVITHRQLCMFQTDQKQATADQDWKVEGNGRAGEGRRTTNCIL